MRNGAFFYRCPEYACQHFFSLPIQATRRTETSLLRSSSEAIREKKVSGGFRRLFQSSKLTPS